MKDTYQLHGELHLHTNKGIYVCGLISMEVDFPEYEHRSAYNGPYIRSVCSGLPTFKAICLSMDKIGETSELTRTVSEKNDMPLSQFSEDELLQELMRRTSKVYEKD